MIANLDEQDAYQKLNISKFRDKAQALKKGGQASAHAQHSELILPSSL
jgi:hypothetical protein